MVSKFLWGVRFIRAPETPTTAVKQHRQKTSSNSDTASQQQDHTATATIFFGGVPFIWSWGYGLLGGGYGLYRGGYVYSVSWSPCLAAI